MADTIAGTVVDVIGGNAFVMAVEHQEVLNSDSYGETETVLMAGFDSPASETDEGRAARDQLKDELEGERVVIDVVRRDTAGRVVGRLWVLHH